MNLQHQRIEELCHSLNLMQIAENYLDIAQSSSKEDSSYTDFLESILKGSITLLNMESRFPWFSPALSISIKSKKKLSDI
ncbi:hypothetical protein [Rickettsia felis]|uniref:hypothetical protein n=1 Tax=Rickettsia felis TaxID=42862 RepID=UPI0005759E6A|nr:hypothetical protein [Rickettsia felis]KHO02806.1 hypothetical protein JS55_02570 [Rickettsia felis str. LSU]